MGAAVAYHLALFGWGCDTMVLEQGIIGGGSQSHSSGIMGTFKPTLTQVKLAQSSIELIRSLEEAGEWPGGRTTRQDIPNICSRFQTTPPAGNSVED